MNNEHRSPTEEEKLWAWENVAGVHPSSPNKIYSPIKCPYEDCEYSNSLMDWNNYGSQTNTSWEVDHKIPLSKGGGWSKNNLQAMHSYCNRIKGDK